MRLAVLTCAGRIILCSGMILLLFSGSTVEAQIWVKKLSTDGAVGYPLAYNPLKPSTLYAAVGHNILYVSRDKGVTWSQFGNAVYTSGAIKSIAINPLDTTQFVIGLGDSPSFDRILKSTDNGMTWNPTYFGTFSYFGKPIEFNLHHPDTMFAMTNDTLIRSNDFGSTWDTVRSVRGLFNLWCDGEMRPDSANILFAGDNSSGIWKSVDYGLHWRKVFSSTGEIPSIYIDQHNPSIMYAGRFAGGGGYVKSTDAGETWNLLDTPIGYGAAWWITGAVNNPGYLYIGTYGEYPTGPYSSRDQGATWTRIAGATPPTDSISAYNYGLLAVDTNSVIALQYDGLYHLEYLPGINIISPNGGENWKAGAAHSIVWTDSNLVSIRIDLSTDGGSTWTTIASSIPKHTGNFTWNVPDGMTQQSSIRIVDELDSTISDISDKNFTIYDTAFTIISPNGGESWTAGEQYSITWQTQVVTPSKLEFSLDGGISWAGIIDTMSTVGEVYWAPPDTDVSVCKIRVVSSADSLLSDESDSVFTIHRCIPESAIIFAESSWSLISLPLLAANREKSFLFPNALTPALGYVSGYVVSDTLLPGKGYWIKSPRVTIEGCPFSTDTISVTKGWNMIGTVSDTIPVASIKTIPAGLFMSSFYGFLQHRYVAVPSLEPGRGYWIKTRESGVLIMSSTLLSRPVKHR